MQHPELGELLPSDTDPKSVHGKVLYGEREIAIVIDPDDKTLDESIVLAAEIAKSLTDLDGRAKAVITRDLLEAYNSGWNEYQVYGKDGSREVVSNPTLTPAEFENKFVLTEISVYGNECFDLWYEDGGLFWGHSIYVGSFDGVLLKDAHAQLFG